MNEARIFEAHEDVEAMAYFTELFQTAKNELLIVDKYIDATIFDLINEVPESVKIRLLTGPSRIKSGFAKMLADYGKSNISCRIDETGHFEKYVIIDGGKVYHLSGSFNAITKAGMTVTQVDDAEIIASMKNLWSNANALR